ncbi:SCO7613 C-terminal domain-containing membrane protein [Streptomyces sp. NPDC002602]|uniref:SCO7613 C-terminal domain-containing membrane protein n=1 Tax=Streptomyces sp. NPDC002602 TaxID=3364654 RepID=UPI0036CD59A4
MNTPLSPAEELALIAGELARLDARRAHLAARRDWLLRLPPIPWPSAPAPSPPSLPVKDASGRGAQNVLLTLGAVLLSVAALTFTLVSWGSLGIAGRAAALAVVTAGALVAPLPLLRRGLRSTAESVAALGLLLTVLDAYAVHAVGLSTVDAAAYASGAAGVLAALWAGYGFALPGLWLPLPVAVAAAQLPLPLAALACAANPVGLGWALLATAALDVVAAMTVPRARAAWPAGAALGVAALGVGWVESAAGPGAAAPALLLAAGAALGVAVAWRVPRASAAALAGGLAAVVAVAGPLSPRGDTGWAAPTHLAVALALTLPAVVGTASVPAAVRRGLARAGLGVAAVAALWALASVVPVLAARLRGLGEVWAATTPEVDRPGTGAAVAVTLLVTAGAAAGAARLLPARPEPGVLAVVLGWAGLFAAPVLLGFPVAAVLAAQLSVTVAAGALALRPRPDGSGPGSGLGIAAAGCALLGAGNVAVGALDGRLATVLVLGALTAAGAAGAAYRPGPGWARSGAAVLAVGWATALVVTLCALSDLAVVWWAPPVLAVPAAVVAFGPRWGAVRLPAEAASIAPGMLALALAAPDRPALAVALALAGVVCATAAVRADRRRLGWAAWALFVAATWVRLSVSGVVWPEAYTLPVTIPALVVGFVRRRRDPAASSWTAYAPGLAATLLPALIATWGDPHWQRPLLLGLASPALTLLGAHRRLQAPLLLGGATLAAVALHELAPYVVQVVGALPRWLPAALVGLLLLAVGATYERRLRDARRLRAAFGRLG